MTWQDERRLRQEIAAIHRQLYDLGFSVANDGNTSCRIGKDRILITPKGLNKATLEPQQMALVDDQGHPIRGSYEPSSEIPMHLEIYRTRPDINSIVHAHPPYLIACSIAGISLSDPVLPEVILTLGKIPTVPYVPPGTKEMGLTVAEYMKTYDAIILQRHGAVSIGCSLHSALQKMERAEHTAKILSIAKAMGSVPTLSALEIERLHRETGIPPRTDQPLPEVKPTDPSEDMVEMIAREVALELAKRKK